MIVLDEQLLGRQSDKRRRALLYCHQANSYDSSSTLSRTAIRLFLDVHGIPYRVLSFSWVPHLSHTNSIVGNDREISSDVFPLLIEDRENPMVAMGQILNAQEDYAWTALARIED